MSKPLKPINAHLDSVTIPDIENHKLITTKELIRDLDNLKAFSADTNANNFFGNPFLYHYQFKNLLKCRRKDGKTIYDIHADSTEWDKLIDSTRKRNRTSRRIRKLITRSRNQCKSRHIHTCIGIRRN
jgi:hypothetical protein